MKHACLFALLAAAPFDLPVRASEAPAAAAAAAVVDRVDWPPFLARHDLTWEKLPAKWHEGAFIGNGLLGAMIYLSDDGQSLRWDLGRSDVADRGGRIPVGTLTLKTAGPLQGGTLRLDLWNAEASGTLKTGKGEIKFRSFTHASDLFTAVELETSEGERGAQFEFTPGLAANARKVHKNEPLTDAEKNPEPQTGVENGVRFVRQPLHDGVEEATAWRELVAAPNQRTLFVSTALVRPQAGERASRRTATGEAAQAVSVAAQCGLATLTGSHRAWWHAFWPQSFVSIPDTRMESFYWIQMYKLASATRAGRPAIDLMGPWFRSTPWPMIWWNLNIQLTYWPVYASNRLELGESLTRMIDAGQPDLIANVPEKWRHDSAAIGRTSSYDCKGGAGKELGNLTWALHNYWLQCRYSMDEAKLRSLFPILQRAVNFMTHHLAPGGDGKLHFPVDISPEYPTAAADTNYNLALVRWGLTALIEANERLQMNDPALPRWKETLDQLTPYPVDEKTGLMIGQDVPLAESHRHFSHLLMIYPLYLLNWEQPESRALIEQSLNHWIGFQGALQGYSYTGAAAIKAQMGKGDDAARLLNQFLDSYVKANTMYLEAGPVIETPLAGAASLHEMLLQSWGGKIRVFPALPAAWKDVTIHNLRAEGGFLVSAARREGRTQWVRITSLAGEPCRAQADFLPEARVLTLKKGESVLLRAPGAAAPLVEPVTPQEGRLNFYGSRKASAQPPVAAEADGSFTLRAGQASLNGEWLFVEKKNTEENIGRWIDAREWVSWNATVAVPGRFTVTALYSTPGGGNNYSVTAGGQKFTAQVQATGGWANVREFPLGEVEITQPGAIPVEVRAEGPLRGALFNLQSVRLVPVK